MGLWAWRLWAKDNEKFDGGSWKVKGAYPIDLINPRLAGKTFVFEAPHAKRHVSTDPADQEIKTFRMQQTGKNEAAFKNEPTVAT